MIVRQIFDAEDIGLVLADWAAANRGVVRVESADVQMMILAKNGRFEGVRMEVECEAAPKDWYD